MNTLPEQDIPARSEQQINHTRQRAPLGQVLIARAELAITFVLACFFLFYRLDVQSAPNFDEAVTISAIHTMKETGNWWLPHYMGLPYLHKPPFKMWLSLVPLSLLGESNFSYRLIDVLAALGTCLLTFSFARRLVPKTGSGLIAVAALLGCRTFMLEHGARNAVHDSLLVFLTCLALDLGTRYFHRMSEQSSLDDHFRKSLRLGLTTGITIGCAALTKSVAGFLPFLVLASYFLLFIPKRNWVQAIVPVLLPALILPALYYLPHFIFTPNAWNIVIDHELVERALIGFHHTDHSWFYLRDLTVRKSAVPIAVLTLAILWAAYHLHQSRKSEFALLLLWLLFPIAIYSLAKSRLGWYLAPSFPAMAVLIGGFLGTVFHLRPKQLRHRLLISLLACYSIYALGNNLIRVYHRIERVSKHDLNKLSDALLADGHSISRDRPVIVFFDNTIDIEEAVYLRMLGTEPVFVTTLKRLREEKLKHPFSPVFTDFSKLYDVIAFQQPSGYRFIRPYEFRKRWGAFLWYGGYASPQILTPWNRTIILGSGSLRTTYAVDKDRIISHYPLKVSIEPLSKVARTLVVSVNNAVVCSFSMPSLGVPCFIQPDLLQEERTIIDFRVKQPLEHDLSISLSPAIVGNSKK